MDIDNYTTKCRKCQQRLSEENHETRSALEGWVVYLSHIKAFRASYKRGTVSCSNFKPRFRGRKCPTLLDDGSDHPASGLSARLFRDHIIPRSFISRVVFPVSFLNVR